jgi:hypothetical protein
MTDTVNHTTHTKGFTMSVDYTNTNLYPRIETIENITTAAVEIFLPRDCTSISFGSAAALHFANVGADGNTFGNTSSGANINAYSFVPANNMLSLTMETGRQSNRILLVATQSGVADLHIILTK